jgi:hypothetical protein
MIMSGVKITPRELWWDRIVWFRHVSEHEDPRFSFTNSFMGKIGITRDIHEIYPVIAPPPKEQYKIAASAYRLQHIDFCADYCTIALAIAVQIATVACDAVCNIRTHDWNSEG